MKRWLSFVLSALMIIMMLPISSITANATTSADFSISENGIAFICAREGFHSKCYSDNTQSSIGYGTKCTGSSIQPHASGSHSITKAEAMQKLKSQINSTYAPRVRKQTAGISMHQNQFDALVSLCYNCGGGTSLISNSPLVKYLKGQLTESQARTQYANYIVTSGGKKLQGLVNRRNLEADLFFKGADNQYSDNPDDYTTPNTTVSYGNIGSNVAWVQAVLYQLGYNIVIDGSFGPATKEAVKNFQSDNNLDVDGSVGPITRKELLDCWNAKNRGELNIVLHVWVSDSIMGDTPASYEPGKTYYLCYEIIDANSGEKIDDIVSKTYSVTETMYNSDGTVKHTYTYSNDNNYIGAVQYGIGTYKCKVTVSGDINCALETQYTISQDRVTAAHIWVSEKGQGYDQSDCPAIDTGIVQTRYYYWYKIYDQNSGALLSTYANKNFEVEMSVFYSDGTQVYSTTYKNSDVNWISWVPQRADIYTIKFTITGDLTGTITSEIVVDYDTKLAAKENSLALELNGINSKTSTFTVSGGCPGNYGIRYSITDPSIVSCSWGGWSGSSIPLTVTGLKRGSTNIVVEVYENYTGNKEVVASYILPVTVTSNSYTISYNANGGIGAPSSQTKYYNEPLILSTTKPTRNGHTFLGWATSSAAASVAYLAGDSYTSNSSVILYAVWQPNTYTVTFNANGGTTPMTNKSVTYNSTYGTLPTPTKNGCTFNGWYTAENGGTQVTSSSQVMITAPQTLYAHWTATASYTVSYNANGGSGAPLSQTKYYNESLTIPTTAPIRMGYTFLGWSTSSSATSPSYYAGGTYTSNSSTTLYAVWKANTYTVSYDSNGGTLAPASQIKYYDVDIVLSKLQLSREGYIFLGWSESQTATKASYIPGDIYNENKSVTLFAVWEEETSSLLGDVNGDGEIDAADAGLISRYDAGFVTLTSEQLKAGDVNKDGVVDAADAGLISRYDAGLIQKLG